MSKTEGADFTHKELCLLLSTICEHELGVVLRKNIADVRKDRNLFEDHDEIKIKKINNKQGTTRVTVFRTTYGYNGVAYTTTI